MKTLLLSLLVLTGAEFTLLADPGITFDDSASVDGNPVGPGYHLLNWNNFFFLIGTDYPNSGYPVAAVSPPYVIWSGGGFTGTISGGMFDLLSVDATAGWDDGLVLEAKGYFKGTLLYDQTSFLSATSPIVITYDFFGVDEVDFTTTGGTPHAGYSQSGTEFALDNVNVNTYVPYRPGFVVNGGFETGDFTGWQWGGNTNDTFVTNTSTYVHSGNFGAQLGPSITPGFLGQDLSPTQIGQLYNVSFWLKSNTNSIGATTPNNFTVFWNGLSVFGLTNVGVFDWTNFSFNLPASQADQFLQFQYQDNPAFFGLDDVSVTPAVLVSNGGFETDNFLGWNHFGNSGSDSVSPDVARVGTYGASMGAVGSPSFLSQSIITQPGQPYLISAWLYNNAADPQANQFEAFWSDQTLANITNFPASSVIGWTNLHYTVLNGNNTNTLEFGFQNDPDFFYFDEVSVWAVPILYNGGFEFGDFNGWTGAGTFTSAFIESTNVSSGYYAGALHSVGSVAFLSQSVTTVPGQSYFIRFFVNNFTSDTTGVEFSVSWNGKVLMDTTNVGTGWNLQRFMVTATGTASTLQFGFRDDLHFLGLDNVSISPLTPPEFESITKTNGLVTMNWSEMPGYSYELQYATNLAQTNWPILQNVFLPSSVPITSYDTNPPDAHRFYRVQMFPPPLL